MEFFTDSLAQNVSTTQTSSCFPSVFGNIQPYIMHLNKCFCPTCSFIVELFFVAFSPVIIAVHVSLSAPFSSNLFFFVFCFCFVFRLCFLMFFFSSDSSNHKHVICY